jgi:F0F1-type ATP synthase membrane subunit b/b'
MDYEARRAELRKQLNEIYNELNDLTRMQKEEESQNMPLELRDLSNEQIKSAVSLVLDQILKEAKLSVAKRVEETLDWVLTDEQWDIMDTMTWCQKDVFNKAYREMVWGIVEKKIKELINL